MAAMDASRGMYTDVETADVSDLEVRAERPARFASGGRAAGAAAVLLGVGAAAAVLGSGSRARAARASALATGAVELDQASQLKPLELLHDGNVCDLNEELYGNLCYKKCKLLTNGLAPVRTSPWSCCESSPCNFQKEHAGVPLPCHGFDVSGAGGCPHKAGACLLDEELYLGECFKKCSILTNGAYPFRTAAATCCKSKGLACLNLQNDLTSSAFAVGGGGGDGDASTPSTVHLPLKELTEAGDEPTASPAEVSSAAAPVSEASLRPLENTHDGNVCDDQEELHDGLCYKRCALLTAGVAPIRTSAWTCCESHPCHVKNQHGRMGVTIMCNGFDVSAQGKCPHKPGACLIDEEMFMGVCYKQCSMLTGGEYPHRVGAASCCKSKSGLGCLNPFNDKTSFSFAVGGGSEGLEAQAHAPEERLTEDEGAAPAAEAAPAAAPAEAEAQPSSPLTFGVATDSMKEVMKKL